MYDVRLLKSLDTIRAERSKLQSELHAVQQSFATLHDKHKATEESFNALQQEHQTSVLAMEKQEARLVQGNTLSAELTSQGEYFDDMSTYCSSLLTHHDSESATITTTIISW